MATWTRKGAYNLHIKMPRLTLTRAIAAGFALLILTGALLLMLPVCSRDGRSLRFADALFTATSASCVTGLVVCDTWTQFSRAGQVVLLLLIQVGGLGFMSVTLLVQLVLGRRVGLRERALLVESIGSMRLGGVVRMVRRALIGTALLELGGAALLALRFVPRYGLNEGLFCALFHSVSAFCNAGFDLLGREAAYGSLTPFRADPVVNLTICGLILSGGLGFIVWNDLVEQRGRVRRFSLHTRIVLTVTILVTLLGWALFFVLEQNYAFAGMPIGERALAALFQSVSPRTAGFNTVEMSDLSEGGLLLTMLLMLVGASPGSTGGGLKTTTLAVLALSVIAYARNTEDINAFRRRLPPAVVRRAFCTAAAYLLLLLAGAFLIVCAQNLPLRDIMFEACSAVGTVGLSTGVTRELNGFSRMIIILLMFSGRVGTLSVAAAMAEPRRTANVRNPEEKITIG